MLGGCFDPIATKRRELEEGHIGDKPALPPVVLIDAMASGGSVLQVAQLMEDVQDQHKNLVGVEMESYSVSTAAEYASDPRPVCFSIKAVCDFGDELIADGVMDMQPMLVRSFFIASH
jgi:hypothetical protein